MYHVHHFQIQMFKNQHVEYTCQHQVSAKVLTFRLRLCPCQIFKFSFPSPVTEFNYQVGEGAIPMYDNLQAFGAG